MEPQLNFYLVEMARQKKERKIVVRLSENEFQKLQCYSNRKEWTKSQTIREYIRRLPSPPEPQVLSAIEQPLNLPVARIAEPEPLLIEDIDETELPKGTSRTVIEAWEARGFKVVLVPRR